MPPVNIVDVDEFTDPVQAPGDGDPANGATFQLGHQDHANRTRNLKNRLDQEITDREEAIADVSPKTALYTIATTATTNGDKFDLTTVEQDTGFSQASDEVTPPGDGVYEFTVTLRGTSDDAATTYYSCGVALYLGASLVRVISFGSRNTANASGLISLNGAFKKRFTGIGSDKFSIEFIASGSDVFTPSGGLSHTFTVTRLGP